MSNALYDALRDAGLDVLRAHRLDLYVHTVTDAATAEHLARSLRDGRRAADPTFDGLRAGMVADLDAVSAGLDLLAPRAG